MPHPLSMKIMLHFDNRPPSIISSRLYITSCIIIWHPYMIFTPVRSIWFDIGVFLEAILLPRILVYVLDPFCRKWRTVFPVSFHSFFKAHV